MKNIRVHFELSSSLQVQVPFEQLCLRVPEIVVLELFVKNKTPHPPEFLKIPDEADAKEYGMCVLVLSHYLRIRLRSSFQIPTNIIEMCNLQVREFSARVIEQFIDGVYDDETKLANEMPFVYSCMAYTHYRNLNVDHASIIKCPTKLPLHMKRYREETELEKKLKCIYWRLFDYRNECREWCPVSATKHTKNHHCFEVRGELLFLQEQVPAVVFSKADTQFYFLFFILRNISLNINSTDHRYFTLLKREK